MANSNSSKKNTPKRKTPKQKTPKRTHKKESSKKESPKQRSKSPKNKSKSPKNKSKKHKSKRQDPPMNPRLRVKPKPTPIPIPTKVERQEQPPRQKIYSRVNPNKALEERMSPYFGHEGQTQFGIDQSSCLSLDLDQLRKIARQANKLIENPKDRIKGYNSPEETKESLCQKLIMKKINVLANGKMTLE